MASKSSDQWLKEHFSDPYVKQAQKAGYRSRAVYKLMEIDDRDHLLRPGMVVVDLGAAPGGWSQIASNRVGKNGTVVALDLLPIEPIPNVMILQGDFSSEETLNQLLAVLPGAVDVILSDMAPNMSGHDSVDVPRAMYLSELALDFAMAHLKPDGAMLMKIFQGEGFQEFYALLKRQFKTTTIRKPKASRGRSREIYVLAKGFKGP
jgi:23S rRNA (uridine2552-2'-O)-methyltransferase